MERVASGEPLREDYTNGQKRYKMNLRLTTMHVCMTAENIYVLQATFVVCAARKPCLMAVSFVGFSSRFAVTNKFFFEIEKLLL